MATGFVLLPCSYDVRVGDQSADAIVKTKLLLQSICTGEPEKFTLLYYKHTKMLLSILTYKRSTFTWAGLTLIMHKVGNSIKFNSNKFSYISIKITD